VSEIDPQYLRRLNWYGAKPIAATLLTLPVIGRAIRHAANAILPARIVHRLPISDHHTNYLPIAAEPIRLLDPLHDSVAKNIYWGRGQPTSPADALVLRLVEKLAPEISTFADVGSYSALFALVAARCNPTAHAVAYDIVPENYAMMVSNIEANGLSDRVKAKLLGLSDAAGTIIMPARTDTLGKPSAISIGSTFKSGIEVPLTTLDAEGLSGPLMMKLDVETYEWAVLQGGRATVERLLPTIVCEILPRFKHCEEMSAWLKSLGYRFFLATDTGFTEYDVLALESSRRDWVLTVNDLPQI